MVTLRSLCFSLLFVLLVSARSIAQSTQDVPFFSILSPSSAASSYASVNGDYGLATFGPGLSGGDVIAEVAMGLDSLMCNPANEDFTNKIVLIPRGSCEFSRKILNAQQRGAVGVIIWNFSEDHLNMGSGSVGDSVTIPSIFIPQSIGNVIKDALSTGPVVVAFSNNPIGFHIVHGFVRHDENADCTVDPAETGLQKFTAIAIGAGNKTYAGLSQPDGRYSIYVDTLSGPYTVTLAPPSSLWSFCPGGVSVAGNTSNDSTEVNFQAQATVSCPAMTASITSPFLRRCFENYFAVEVCNMGTAAAADAYVLIDLDPFMLPIQTASLPYTIEPDGRYRFELGDMGINACTDFNFSAVVSCDSTIIGQTLCYEAHAYPDSLCNVSQSWSGASVSVTGQCEGDSIRFNIINSGTAPMTAPQSYIVIEDDLMLQGGQFDLQPGQSFNIALPANGATWRLEAGQEPNHPVMGTPATTVEGCTTGNSFTTGYYLMFPQYDPGQSVDIECQEIVGSYDPNDKQALPRGYGDEHLVLPNTGLEYLIRFQNTGTDTAFTVVVRDTLSNFLQPATLRPGVSSHPYTLNIYEGRILEFRFENILLVDSFTNEAASHGFLKFYIDQQPFNPIGTQITNRAGIYFDFNPPVMTNTVQHKVGYLPHVVTAVAEPGQPADRITVYPNPAEGTASIRVTDPLPEGTRWQLRSPLGQLLRAGRMNGQELQLQLPGLPAGLYLLEWQQEGRRIGTARLMIR